MNSNEKENSSHPSDAPQESTSTPNPEKTSASQRVPFLQRTSPLEVQLLALLRRPEYRPAKAKLIAAQLKLKDEEQIAEY